MLRLSSSVAVYFWLSPRYGGVVGGVEKWQEEKTQRICFLPKRRRRW